MVRPAKPEHERKAKMVPIRMTADYFEWLQRASGRHGISMSDLMREGARVFIEQLEQKGGPGKEGECKRSANRISKDR